MIKKTNKNGAIAFCLGGETINYRPGRYKPQEPAAPSPSCVHTEEALCGTEPGRWSRTSELAASPPPPTGPGTVGSVPGEN